MLTKVQKSTLEKTTGVLRDLAEDLAAIVHQLEDKFAELPRHRQRTEDGSEIQDTIERLKTLMDEIENASDLADDIAAG